MVLHIALWVTGYVLRWGACTVRCGEQGVPCGGERCVRERFHRVRVRVRVVLHGDLGTFPISY